MIKKYLVTGYVLLILFPSLVWGADKIQGNACYSYGDIESLVQAEQMTKTLAIRNAIESYGTFIESTTQITDLQLSSDLINTVSAGQVKGLNVLKRLQSGRKICYTVEGYVEPFEMQTAIKNYLSKQRKKGSDVRLQENGWIRIVDTFPVELTPEERYKGEERLITEHKKFVKLGLRRENFRRLNVKLQFLKPCIPSKLDYDFASKEALLSLKVRLYNIYKHSSVHEYEKAEALRQEYEKGCTDNGIDPARFEYDVQVPAFRCDYRTKVFATFFSSDDRELGTENDIPRVLLLGEKVLRTEILPGEETYVVFGIPEQAESWEVWVPK